MSLARDIADLGSSATNLDTAGSNVVINGAMNVAQRATSATGVGSGFAYPTIDRYKIVPSTSGRATMTQTADGPVGFANCLKCTTADTSIAATEYFILRQSFEGQDLQHFKKGTSSAEKIVVSFYVKGNASATYTCELDDSDNTRHNSQEFSVTTNWTRVILTFDGDTTGAFDDDNARSLNLDFWLHAGSNYTGGTHTDNVWHTTDNQRVGDNQTSFFDSTSRTFFITGIQMEAKRVTDFEHRSFDDELRKCYRYYQLLENTAGSLQYLGLLQAYNTNNVFGMVSDYILPMRAVPTVGQSGDFKFAAADSSGVATGAIANLAANSTGWYSSGWGSASGAIIQGGASVLYWANGSKLTADAEL
jgi:hypothetical protein